MPYNPGARWVHGKGLLGEYWETMEAPPAPGRVRKPTPWVTYALIAANVIVYLYTSASNGFMAVSNYWVNVGAYTPILPLIDPSSIYRIFTSMFMHADPLHIFFNMYFLYLFGRGVEAALGPIPYLILYLVSGVAAVVFHTAFSYLFGGAASLTIPVLGASGAISGVLGAYLILYPGTKLLVCTWFIFLPFCFPIYSAYLLIFWFALQVLYGMASVGAGVAFFAHAGGFVTGVALLPLLARRERIEALRGLGVRRYFGFIEFVRGRLGLAARRGLGGAIKAFFAVLVALLVVGSAYAVLTAPSAPLVDAMKINMVFDHTPETGYVVYNHATLTPLGLELVPPEVRVLLNRLRAAGLLYNPALAGRVVDFADRMLEGAVSVCGTPVRVSIYVRSFHGVYDRRGFLLEAEGTIESPVIYVTSGSPIVCRYSLSPTPVLMEFDLHTREALSIADLITPLAAVSLLLSVASLATVFGKDKDLVITPFGAETGGVEGVVPI